MQNPITLSDGDKVPIVDYGVKQANADMTLKSIDAEKYNFEITGLNLTSADIEVIGEDTSLTALAYAIS